MGHAFFCLPLEVAIPTLFSSNLTDWVARLRFVSVLDRWTREDNLSLASKGVSEPGEAFILVKKC